MSDITCQKKVHIDFVINIALHCFSFPTINLEFTDFFANSLIVHDNKDVI